MNEFNKSLPAEGSLVVIGIGDGGGNAAQALARLWPQAPRIAAVNTDQQALAQLDGIERVYIGEKILKGAGAGGDPRLAKQAAESDSEQLRALFHGASFAIMALGLGGGTGSGVAPFLADMARKEGVLTLCVAMLPFEFEGARRKEQAERGLQAIRDLADGVICLPNQRLTALVEDKANIQEAFRRAEAMLAAGICDLWRIIGSTSIIKFNFADLRAFLHAAKGNCIFCSCEGSGERRAEEVLEGIERNALLNGCQALAAADSFAICITGGENLSIAEVDRLVKGIAARGRPGAHAITGVGCEPGWTDKIRVTILASETDQEPAARATAGGRPARAAGAKDPRDSAREVEPGDMVQTGLFDAVEQGRFKGVNPTIIDGSNLDIPTFIRRRIQVQKAKIAGS